MKRIILLLIVFLGLNPVLALNELKDVGIAKYAVLEVTNDNTPIRDKDNENAKRLTHLYKDTVLFADKQTDKYYRVELKDGLYGFINKKNVEVQAIIPEKRLEGIRRISYFEDKKQYNIKIELPERTSYIINENASSLDFTLFDSHFDPIESKFPYKAIEKSGAFEIPSKIANEFKVNYFSPYPLFGYDLEKYDKGYILNVKKAPKINKKRPLKNITVVLDPGHGGVEKGACAFGLEEKAINLQISKKLRKELTKKGAKVYMTRKKDVKVPLYNRVAFAKEKQADILLSIHQNSLANPKEILTKHGVGTYYYNNQAKPLAAAIQKELLISTGFKDDKVNYASFALNRPTAQISVLIECGYIIHPEEAKKISDKKFQKLIAKAIVKGCEKYLVENF